MTVTEMTEQIMTIHGEIMFNRTSEDYSELLASVSELQYFLRNELNVMPPEVITYLPVTHADYHF